MCLAVGRINCQTQCIAPLLTVSNVSSDVVSFIKLDVFIMCFLIENGEGWFFTPAPDLTTSVTNKSSVKLQNYTVQSIKLVVSKYSQVETDEKVLVQRRK